MTPLDAALQYAARGWPVFPVNGKRPYTENGFKDATTKPHVIKLMFQTWPDAGVAIPTGEVSGFDVLDVDAPLGEESLEELEAKHGRLPDTVVSLTGGGGQHLLFKHPGRPVKSVNGKLGVGLDVKADGGYVVVPPSPHASGRPYEWNGEFHPDDLELAALPEWIERGVSGDRTPSPEVGTTTSTKREEVNSLLRDMTSLERPTTRSRHDALLRLVMRWAGKGLEWGEVTTFARGVARRWGMYGDDRPGDTDSEIKNMVEGAFARVAKESTSETSDSQPEDDQPLVELIPATLENIVSPDAGKVDFLVDDLLPRGGATVLAAAFKTGKTLVLYRIALDAAGGYPVLGRFGVDRPARVMVLQLEMPAHEDERRLRRLAIGAGIEPADVLEWVKEGRLTFYSRPDLNLCNQADRDALHEAVRSCGAELVVLDSALAAFAGVEDTIPSNSRVREQFSGAFNPLTSAGVSLLLAHHKRKTPPGGKKDDSRNSILGAQAWVAAADRAYTLDRLEDDDPREAHERGAGKEHAFKLVLADAGSWTPGSTETVLHVYDTPDDGGTVVEALDGPGQLRAGGVNKVQQAGIAFGRLVAERLRLTRQDALALVMGNTGCSERTAKDGLAFASAKGWTKAVASTLEPGCNRLDLVPGNAPMEQS